MQKLSALCVLDFIIFHCHRTLGGVSLAFLVPPVLLSYTEHPHELLDYNECNKKRLLSEPNFLFRFLVILKIIPPRNGKERHLFYLFWCLSLFICICPWHWTLREANQAFSRSSSFAKLHRKVLVNFPTDECKWQNAVHWTSFTISLCRLVACFIVLTFYLFSLILNWHCVVPAVYSLIVPVLPRNTCLMPQSIGFYLLTSGTWIFVYVNALIIPYNGK